MLTFKHNSLEECIVLSPDKLSFLVVENKHKLWECLNELSMSAEGEPTDFILFNEKFESVAISKSCVFETNLATLTINSKKLTTALYKKCGVLAVEPENEYQFRKKINELYNLCKEISLDVGYDVVLREDFEPANVFKLFALEIKEEYRSILEKLIAYVNVNIELLKTKVFIFLFLTKFLNSAELKVFLKHCEMQGVAILLIEDCVSNDEYLENIDYQMLVIDEDLCEIWKRQN